MPSPGIISSLMTPLAEAVLEEDLVESCGLVDVSVKKAPRIASLFDERLVNSAGDLPGCSVLCISFSADLLSVVPDWRCVKAVWFTREASGSSVPGPGGLAFSTLKRGTSVTARIPI